MGGVDPAVTETVRAAVEAGDLDRALETFLPVADVPAEEVQAIRAQEPSWEALRRGVRVFPREHRALQADGLRMLDAAGRPDVPVLYLHGERTEAPVYPSLDEVTARLPEARLQVLPGQKHLAPLFDPEPFARALLQFTTAHDG